MKMKMLIIFIMVFLVLCFSQSAFAGTAVADNAVTITVDHSVIEAGNPIRADFSVNDDSIVINDVLWTMQQGKVGATGLGEFTDTEQGTSIFIPDRAGECWVTISYFDKDGVVHAVKSETVTVTGYEIKITVSGPQPNGLPYSSVEQIEAGTALTVDYEIVGGNDDFTVTTSWRFNYNDDTYASVQGEESHSRTGSVSYTPTDKMKEISFNISVWHADESGRHISNAWSHGNYVVKSNNPETGGSDSEAVTITVDHSVIEAGNQIRADFTVNDESIVINDVLWTMQQGKVGATGLGEFTDIEQGTSIFIPDRAGECWITISYYDADGGVHAVKSETVTVTGYELKLTVSGPQPNDLPYSSVEQIEAGTALTVDYEIVGGNDDFTVTTLWRFNYNDDTYASVQGEESHSRTGSVSYTPTDKMKEISFNISVWHADESGRHISNAWSHGNYVVKAKVPSLTLPTELTCIESQAFAGTLAHKVVIPAAVERIESDAFSEMKNLQELYFEGNPEYIAPSITTWQVKVSCLQGGTVETWAHNAGHTVVFHD